MRKPGKFKRGDYVKAKGRLAMAEVGGFNFLGILEGIVISTRPLIIEYDAGDYKCQIPVLDEAREKIGVITEADDE